MPLPAGGDAVVLPCDRKEEVDCGVVLNTDDPIREQTEIDSLFNDEVKVSGSDSEIASPAIETPVDSESAQSQLRQRAVDNQISRTAISSLLTILKQNYDACLPSDAHTLLKTPVNLTSLIKEKCGGQYYHFGLVKAIDNFVSRHITARESIQLLTHNGLSLRINCDGIPLHRSSRAQF